jgi:hypothetical protein
MRFSLLLLLSIITAVCVLLAMWDWYWSKWLPLAMPHIVLIAVVYWLSRKKWRYALAVSGAYLGIWCLTALYGVPRVGSEIVHSQDERIPDATRIQHVPLHDQFEANSRFRPWKSVGNPTVPCPFVVSIDSAFDKGHTNGGGGREFFFVVPGRNWYLGYTHYWSS